MCSGETARPSRSTRSTAPCSGPAFGEDRVIAFLDRIGAVYSRIESEDELAEHVAGLIESQYVVGWFQGRMEFGPRALGNRSILGDARSREMQEVMNLKIKFRESFRPFAPSVLEDKVHEWFEMNDRQPSPYMLLVADVREDRRVALSGEPAGATGLDKLKAARSTVPAITHVDHSARVQTVDGFRNTRYTRLLEAFERRTGCPVIINTSFNVRGEPIVCTPEDAYRCFMGTNMDALVLGSVVLMKKDQPGGDRERDEAYLAQFELD